MRTHAEILTDAGGPKGIADKLTAAGHPITAGQTRFWAMRKSIPAERWRAIEAAGVSTVEELLAAVEARRLGEQAEAA